MTLLAPGLQAFFTDRLMRQLHASGNTIRSYRTTWRLLLIFTAEQKRKPPPELDFADLSVPAVTSFLDHLEQQRGNTTRTRNLRLAAIHSMFAHAAPLHPEHADDIARVLAVPGKRFRTTIVTHLSEDEITALLQAPDPATWTGRRDHVLLLLAVTTGLRAGEITGLNRADTHLGDGPHLECHGKGRKDRITPLLRDTVTVLAAWIAENPGGPDTPLSPTRRGTPMSQDAIEDCVKRHAAAAALTCPGLASKNVTPHVLRHSCAVRMLRSGIDIGVIALWLGHESTRTTMTYLNSRVLHQPGEKAAGQQVIAVPEWRSVRPDGGRLTRHVFRAIPLDAGSIRWKVEAVGGLSSSASRKEGGWVAGLRCPGRAFRQLEYLTPPLKADLALKQRALDRTIPIDGQAGRYKPPRDIIDFLDHL